jgi:hypothetical protein
VETLQSSINGVLSLGNESLGVWKTYKGGRITTSSSTTKDPGAPFPRIVPGGKKIDSITLGTDYDAIRDSPLEERLEQLAGTPSIVTVGRIERDGAGNIVRIKSRVGKVLEFGPPEGDTNSESDKAQIEVVIGIEG